MTKVVYRGVTYNAEEQKDIFESWWDSVHLSDKKLTYRGIKYNASDVEYCSLLPE